MKSRLFASLLLMSLVSINHLALGSDDDAIEIRIKNHKFIPDKVTVKAGQRFKVRIINEDPTSEEFESRTMVIEKFLGPKRKMVVTLGPLKPGKYEYFGDFNPSTCQGVLTAE